MTKAKPRFGQLVDAYVESPVPMVDVATRVMDSVRRATTLSSVSCRDEPSAMLVIAPVMVTSAVSAAAFLLDACSVHPLVELLEPFLLVFP